MDEKVCGNAGHSLSNLRSVILAEWETLVRGVISSSRHESRMILLDHMPIILDQLLLLMKEGEVDEEELGKKHGYFRLTMTDFSLADVLTEYSLLREVLINYLYPLGDIQCAKLVHKYLDILLKHSVIEYMNTQIVHRSLSIESLGSEKQEILQNPVIPTSGLS